MEQNKQILTVTVSQVNKKIANLIKSERSLCEICVKGEISNFTHHYKTGHFYFTLKDETSSIRAVMFKNSVDSLKWTPENGQDWNGMKVTVLGDVRVFERDGLFQLYAFDMQPDGMGALYIAFLELRERLEKEGLFSQKRPIPRTPREIAVITAETGAAFQDILNILSRRNPLVKVMLFPALVQGINAPKSLISAFEEAQTTNADVILFGRGGGSIEDLQAFNDENLARAVFASKIPTISAVGHEVDFTISDFVADLRAPTPSAAAELSVPDIAETYDYLTGLKQSLRLGISRLISLNTERTNAVSREINAKSPTARLTNYHNQLESLDKQVKHSLESVLSRKKQQLITEMKRIDALSPLNVLMRGYSIVTDLESGKTVVNSAEVNIGNNINIRLHKGRITAEIKEKHG
ncbi:MAG: exodeoxyribonuclease VII large subunit [Oscillospiraceae bacterium]|nr:exodeoxyribonuclease VII large subunit [Oscillospiraceae bacterium]